MTAARVRVAVTDLDREVVVNGEDITALVSRVVVDVAAGPHLPVVTVQFARPDFVFEGDGIVQVASDLDEGDVIAGFLDSLDPDELEREALSGTNLGQSTGLLFVEALHRLAKGAS